MILSRVFSLSLGIFLLVSAFAYIFIDFRPVREQAFDALENKNFESVIDLYSGERYLEEEDYAILSLAVTGLNEEINQKSSKDSKIRSAQSLERRWEIPFEKYEYNGDICIHLKSLYFSQLRNHGYWYQKVTLAMANATYSCNPPQKNSEFLNRILIEDPKRMVSDTSLTLQKILSQELDSIGEWEMNFFREVMHFLSSQETSSFYNNLFLVKGNNVNFRSGPGVENPVIGQLFVDNTLYCWEEDSQTEVIGDVSGNWKKCFSEELFRSGWIFSGQIHPTQPNQKLISDGRERFSNLEFFTHIDFDTWNERYIPHHFHGNYIKTDRVSSKNEVGMRVFRPENGIVETICRKFSGKKNFLEVSYQIESGEYPIPLAELHLVQGGISYPAFIISADENSILLNGERFLIDNPRPRETLSLKITSGAAGYVTGTLVHKNQGVIQNQRSQPIEEKVLRNGSYSWEICIPQAVQRSKDSALLFGFRIGREE